MSSYEKIVFLSRRKKNKTVAFLVYKFKRSAKFLREYWGYSVVNLKKDTFWFTY